MAAIGTKSAKYVNAENIEDAIATVATVQNVEERKNINGVWVSTGRTVTRAAIFFDNGTFTRTKSKHVIATIGQLADEPVNIDNGFAVVINDIVGFGMEPTLYANGKTYDVLTMTVGEK
jgi:hypothetical protein